MPPKHGFWGSQPVIQEDEEAPRQAGPLAPPKSVDDISKEPYPLPSTFEWWSPDYTNPEDVQSIYELLRDNYVEDKASLFRFNYSCDFLRWALTPPGAIRDWMVGVRLKSNKSVLAFIAGVPITIRMGTRPKGEEGQNFLDEGRTICEINFLCVHKKLRVKGMAPILIKEVTRRVNLCNIWQAVYTAGVDLPTPFTVGPYYHRSLNPTKLVAIGFSSVPAKMKKLRNPISAMEKALKLPERQQTKNLRQMEAKDVPKVTALLSEYLLQFQVAPVFNEEEVSHFLLPRDGVVNTYVVDHPENGITDFVSYYTIPSTVIGNAKYSEIKAAYIHYYAHTVTPLEQLINDLLIHLQQQGYDVCNVVEIMNSCAFTTNLKFVIGDGSLRYYFYNWAYPKIKPKSVGLVML